MNVSRDTDDIRIIEVYSAGNEVEAGAVRAALDAAGIEARIVGDRLGNVWGEVPLGFQSEPKIWVREEDAEAARQVIDDLQMHREEITDEEAEAAEFDGGEPDGGLSE